MVTDDREESSSEAAVTNSRSKVARIIEIYGLNGLNEELERRWTAPDDSRQSLRDLADYVNRCILEAAMESADVSSLDGTVENVYRLLTADDISAGLRTQTRKEVSRDGIDIERIEKDFVSHQAVHTYLTNHRGVNLPSTGAREQVEKDARRIQRLQSRTEAVTTDTLDRLAETERITLGSFDVLVDIQVLCKDCGAFVDASQLLADEGCDCG